MPKASQFDLAWLDLAWLFCVRDAAEVEVVVAMSIAGVGVAAAAAAAVADIVALKGNL